MLCWMSGCVEVGEEAKATATAAHTQPLCPEFTELSWSVLTLLTSDLSSVHGWM
jgi:hypothetical protein